MFSTISWASYFEIIFILLVIYYIVILFIYYRKDIQKILSGKTQPVLAASNVGDGRGHLMDEIRALIQQGGYSRSPKEEIIFALNKLLSSERFQIMYQSRNLVTGIIADECKNNCSIHLSEEDVKRLWVSR